mmetsp:Transcript_8428/g.15237  ORF Transcript_8428/g.15237 Transcript_8428/m.15237 type:complete len:215 (-) Transcript_8428:147-791(-)
MPSSKRFPPAMPDQVLCKAHLRAKLEQRKNSWMRQREDALGGDDTTLPEPRQDQPRLLAEDERGGGSRKASAPPNLTTTEALAMLCELGFSPRAAQVALQEADGELEAVVDRLLAAAPDHTTAAGSKKDEEGEEGQRGPSAAELPPRSAAGAAAIRRAEAAAATAAAAPTSELAMQGSALPIHPSSPCSEHSELAEMNDFLAALELQQAELDHL